MKHLKRWAELQCELKRNALRTMDHQNVGQTGFKNRNYIVGQIDAYAEIMAAIEVFGKE